MYRSITTEEQLKNVLKENESIVIYGAGVVAYGVSLALREVCKIENLDFMVSSASGYKMVDSKEVRTIEEINCKDRERLFVVATPEMYHEEIRLKLESKHIKNILFIDNHIEFLLMSLYSNVKGKFKILDNEIPKDYEAKEKLSESSVLVCMCQSIYDVELKNQIQREEFVKTIHVGKQGDGMKSSELVDCVGDNISDRNRMYCELTATYWLWKNSKAKYKGIYHYRRQLKVTKREMLWCIENDIDAIMPLPYICYPNAKGQYGRYIDEEDRGILFQAIDNIVPDEAESIRKILDGEYLYNYNMLIAKEEVFDAYCEWMFPILFRAEEIRKQTRPEGKERFAGYFGEILTSVFFLKNEGKYKILHAQKEWYV